MSHISPVLWQFLVNWLKHFPLFPPEASSIAPYSDALFFALIGMTIAGLLLVLGLVVTFSIRYHKSRHPEAVQIEGSTLLETIWTLTPLGIFLVFFVWGALLYFRIYNAPPNSMNIYVVGKQWMWKVEHPGGQHEIDALHIPIGVPIEVTMISQDVFHSFSIPDFRVKREVIPGRYSTVYFTATKLGKYHLFCSQYCGTDHSAMIGWVYVMTRADYRKWAAGNTSGASLAQNGERLFAVMGCNACHTGESSARGPNLYGLYGSRVRMSDGSTIVANDAYLREKILNPSLHVPEGYVPIMPTFQGQINEEGLIELVEYIKSLDSNYRLKQMMNKSAFDSAQPTPIGPADQGPGAAPLQSAPQQSTPPGATK
ncbi:MAG: cytochrome c oxidase subunit II [Acidobacteriaceae bacterium]